MLKKIINSRPLTYCSQEHTVDAKTPNHLVNPERSAPSVIINKEHAEYAWELDEKEYRLALLHTLECRDTLLAKFVQNWHQQYLLSLREQYNTNYQNPSPHLSHLKVDSIVLLQSPLKSKPFWQLVHIVELLPRPEGEIRSVRIRKPDRATAVASILDLYPLLELEVSQAEGEEDEAHPSEPDAEYLLSRSQVSSHQETETTPVSPPISS